MQKLKTKTLLERFYLFSSSFYFLIQPSLFAFQCRSKKEQAQSIALMKKVKKKLKSTYILISSALFTFNTYW